MPIYEYECQNCQSIEEVLQRFSDPPVVTCSRCSGPMNKLISRSSFHLKGDGWYVTDYAKPSGGKDKKAATENASDKSTDTSDSGTSADKTTKTDE